MTWLTDAHIHLSDPEYSRDIPHILITMEKMKIRACCVSMDFQSSQKTLELAKKSKLVLPFLGIHPKKASENVEPVTELIRKHPKEISGIGEIGLDNTYTDDIDSLKRQENVFRVFLSLAEELKKSVSIHSRRSLDEILSVLPSYRIPGVLLHWFDGSKKQLQNAMDLGCYASFGPVMVYSRDKQVLLSEANPDKILVETDGPVRFSRCFGFKNAQISFIPSVVFCASKILATPYDELSKELEQNCKQYLGI
ncbi:MAG: TatD family hydrolase [Nitrosopumilaceae archaeon]